MIQWDSYSTIENERLLDLWFIANVTISLEIKILQQLHKKEKGKDGFPEWKKSWLRMRSRVTENHGKGSERSTQRQRSHSKWAVKELCQKVKKLSIM